MPMHEQRVGSCRPVALSILNLGARREWVVNATLRPLYAGKRNPIIPTVQYVRLGGPRGRL